MIQVVPHPQPGTAYQFLPETVEHLKGLELPTGTVQVQAPDEVNRVPGRCYVPTSWGTAILDVGDWVVVYDVGVVAVFTPPQFSLLFTTTMDGTITIPDGPLPTFKDIEAIADRHNELQSSAGAMTLAEFSNEVEKDVATELTMGKYVTMPVVTDGADRELPRPTVLPVLQRRVMSDGNSWYPAFEEYCNRYRLDYSLIREDHSVHDFYVEVNATGARIAGFNVGDIIVGYPDGRIEIAKEPEE